MALVQHAASHTANANRSAANMKTFKVTIARILTNYPAKVFTVQAPDIVSAQIRVWRKVKTWHNVIAAEQCVKSDNEPGRAAVKQDYAREFWKQNYESGE